MPVRAFPIDTDDRVLRWLTVLASFRGRFVLRTAAPFTPGPRLQAELDQARQLTGEERPLYGIHIMWNDTSSIGALPARCRTGVCTS